MGRNLSKINCWQSELMLHSDFDEPKHRYLLRHQLQAETKKNRTDLKLKLN